MLWEFILEVQVVLHELKNPPMNCLTIDLDFVSLGGVGTVELLIISLSGSASAKVPDLH